MIGKITYTVKKEVKNFDNIFTTLKLFTNFLLAKINLQIIRLDSSNSLHAFLLGLKKNRIEINAIYDIGAYKGLWTQQLKKYFPNANYFLFEPNISHNDWLKKTKSRYFNVLLGDKKKSVLFYSLGGTGDTIFPEHSHTKVKPVRTTQYKLDSIVRINKLPQADLIKLDAQGAELRILKGALSVIKNCKIIIMETPVMNYNPGAPNQLKYLSYMRKLDFIPVQVIDVHRQRNVVVQIDYVFYNKKFYEEICGSTKEIPFWTKFI